MITNQKMGFTFLLSKNIIETITFQLRLKFHYRYVLYIYMSIFKYDKITIVFHFLVSPYILLMVHKINFTHWGRVTHICISKLTSIGSDNGLLPGQHQAMIWTNVRILLIWTLGTKFSEILKRNSYIFIEENAFENVVWKMAAMLCQLQCVITSMTAVTQDVIATFLQVTD